MTKLNFFYYLFIGKVDALILKESVNKISSPFFRNLKIIDAGL